MLRALGGPALGLDGMVPTAVKVHSNKHDWSKYVVTCGHGLRLSIIELECWDWVVRPFPGITSTTVCILNAHYHDILIRAGSSSHSVLTGGGSVGPEAGTCISSVHRHNHLRLLVG